MLNTSSSATQWILLGKALVFPFREHRRGEPDYLPIADKERFRKDLIQEIEKRGPNYRRQDIWYLRYYHQPYMSTFTAEQFNSRWVDIQDNLTKLSSDLKISPADARKKPIWIERFTDLIAESQFRGGIPSSLDRGILVEQFAKNTSTKIKHIDLNLWEKNYVFKFGQKKYNQQALHQGKIRFVRSGRYSANDMNKAQQDDENLFTFSVMPAFLKDLDGMSGLTSFDKSALENGIQVEFSSQSDYLVWCAAASYDPRLPYAFKADSVLIIKDRQRFEKDVRAALLDYYEKYYVRTSQIKYLDPYIDLTTKLDVPFTKHFRFSYQNEYRIVAEGAAIPEELFIDIPNLKNYAELIDLK